MTRATSKPVIRVVGQRTQFVIEVRDDTCTMRPKGSRRGGKAELSFTWSAAYVRMFRRPHSAGKVKRGLLTVRG